jgi:hypothetical protein
MQEMAIANKEAAARQVLVTGCSYSRSEMLAE